jgi:hypothetical protein
MKQQVIDENYMFVPSFLDGHQLGGIRNDWNDIILKGDVTTDERKVNGVHLNYNLYNPSFLMNTFILSSISVSDMINECVLPTYCWIRRYINNNNEDILSPHLDRGSCDVSLSICLDPNGYKWPFWIKTPKQESVELKCSIGDGVIYLGCRAVHWRNKMPDDIPYFDQMFFHFVRYNGPMKRHAYEFANMLKQYNG